MHRNFIRLLSCAALAALSVSAIAQSPASGVSRQHATPVHDVQTLARAQDGNARHQRFIVSYRAGLRRLMAAEDVQRTVDAAAARAGLRHASLLRGASVPMIASHVRRLAVGADLVRTSRPLDRDDTQRLLRQIASDPAVEHVEVDAMLQHTGIPAQTNFVPDDYEFSEQWHLHGLTGGIRAPAAWDRATGEGVVVAVLDTGITPHPDLDDNMLPGYDFISDATISRRPTSARVPGALDYGDWTEANACFPGTPAQNSSWHGTHVTGTVVEMTDNGLFGAGVAHAAKALPVRVLGRCGGATSDIVDAIVWAAGGDVAGVPPNEHPAEVINLSLSGFGVCESNSAIQQAIDRAVNAGTTVVVAAGNDGNKAEFFTPASCANVVTVGATGFAGNVAGYTNFGDAVDLAAPGGRGAIDGAELGYVWQAWHGAARQPEPGTFTFSGMAGTSMAAPHVSGVVALMQSVAPTPLTPAQIEAELKDTARPPSFPPPGNQFLELITLGAGNLHAARAVARVAPCPEGECTPSDIVPIELGARVPYLSGTPGYEWTFSVEVAAGSPGLTILTYGGVGDMQLLAGFGAPPTAEDAEFRSSRPGNNERIRIPTPSAGTYYVTVRGVSELSSDVTLQVREQ